MEPNPNAQQEYLLRVVWCSINVNTTEYTHYTYNPANVRRVEDTPVFPVFIKYNPSSRPVQLDTSDAVAFTTCKTCVLMCV